MSGAGCPRVTHPFAALPSQGLPLERFPLDLHVLGTPPAFVLSQDQTLRREPLRIRSARTRAGFVSVRWKVGLRGRHFRSGLLCCMYDRRRFRTRRTAPSLDGDAHWLLAHCSVLKVRARTPADTQGGLRRGVAPNGKVTAVLGWRQPDPVPGPTSRTAEPAPRFSPLSDGGSIRCRTLR